MSMALLIGIFILLIEITKKVFNNQLSIRIITGCAFSLVLIWFFYEGALGNIETCLLLVFSFLGVFSFQISWILMKCEFSKFTRLTAASYNCSTNKIIFIEMSRKRHWKKSNLPWITFRIQKWGASVE